MSKKTLICFSLLMYTFACSEAPSKLQFSRKSSLNAAVQDSSKDLVGQLNALAAVSGGKMRVVEDSDSLNEIEEECNEGGEEEEFPEGEEEFPEGEEEFPEGEEEFPEGEEEFPEGEEEFPEGEEEFPEGEEEFPEDEEDCPEDEEEFPEGEEEFPEGEEEFPEGEEEFPEGEEEFPEGEEEFPEDEGEVVPGVECNDDVLAAGKAALLNLIKPLFVFLSEEQVQEIIDTLSTVIPDSCESNLQPKSTKITAAIVSKDSPKSALLVDSAGQIKKVKLPEKLVKKLLK